VGIDRCLVRITAQILTLRSFTPAAPKLHEPVTGRKLLRPRVPTSCQTLQTRRLGECSWWQKQHAFKSHWHQETQETQETQESKQAQATS
jgi:hypothetical protein